MSSMAAGRWQWQGAVWGHSLHRGYATLASGGLHGVVGQLALSISRPPPGLPKHGQAYFLEDVLTAREQPHKGK